MKPVEAAVKLLREAGAKPKEYSVYVLVKEVDEALERMEFLRALGVKPFAQPYRDFTTNAPPTRLQKRLARWVNMRACFESCEWKDYKG